jgi:threonine dehydratase
VPRGVRVVGVEPEGSAALSRALAAGKPVGVAPRTIASGLDAPFAGAAALELCQVHGIEVVTVPDDEIEAAMRRLYADVKLACEPAGAAAVAAILSGRVDAKSMVAVVSGGNVGPKIASAILARP